LVLDGADSTIEQTIHLRINQLAATTAGGIEEIIEERRARGDGGDEGQATQAELVARFNEVERI
jgi:hypothetical protein